MNIEKIKEHYEHAKQKHPGFCDCLCFDESHVGDLKEYTTGMLGYFREKIKYQTEHGNLHWVALLECEIWEVCEALSKHDTAQAIEELRDCIAVCLRTIDVLEGRQELGKSEEIEEIAAARVWCKNDPTRKCVCCEGCPSTEGDAE